MSMLSESVVSEHDVQEPARFAQAYDGSDISLREWSGGVDDQFAREQADAFAGHLAVCQKVRTGEIGE